MKFKLKKLLGVSLFAATVIGSVNLNAFASVLPGQKIDMVFDNKYGILYCVGDERERVWEREYDVVLNELPRELEGAREIIRRVFPGLRSITCQIPVNTGIMTYIFTEESGKTLKFDRRGLENYCLKKILFENR